jgi:hypothetical protein
VDARGFPESLPEFQKVFPNDAACLAYLEKMKWPDGFVCPRCTVAAEPYRTVGRPLVLRCRSCKGNAGVTAGTVMEKTHTPLSTWFWGAYLVATQTPGQSALQFQRQLGLTRYETAFQILHKLRAGMVRPERDQIGGEYPVEVDEVLIGGRTRGEGMGVHHKAYVIGAVEVRTRKPKEGRASKSGDTHDKGVPLKLRTYAGRLRLQVIPERIADQAEDFIAKNILSQSKVKTDGWLGYDGVRYKLGMVHSRMVMNDDPDRAEAHLPMVHLVFSNLKAWIQGTHHGVSQTHLQAYLNEYAFRFNRRFYPMTAFHSVLGIGTHSAAPTYDSLYSGDWVHPGGPRFLPTGTP